LENTAIMYLLYYFVPTIKPLVKLKKHTPAPFFCYLVL
jgi:hypothetical protein